MSAPVRIEAEAWSDLRFATLARILGLADLEHALIKTAKIWSWQTEHYTPDTPTYEVDADLIESALGSGGAEAMVRSRLAVSGPGGYRIRGSQGRIEWLWQRRQASKAGGEATKRKQGDKTGPGGPLPAQRPARPKPGPLVPALVPSLPEDALSRACAIQGPEQVPEPPPQPVPPPVLPTPGGAAQEARRRLIGKAWDFARIAFHRVQASGIDSTAPNGWAGLPAADDPPMANLRAIVDSLLVGESPDHDAALRRIQNRVLVAEAEARAMSPPSARYMTPARMWNRESFSIAVDMSVEQASRPASRAGPRGSAERAPEPPRKITTWK